MNNQSNDRQWLRYIETLRQQSQPVKIDVLLQKRMQAFIAARQEKMLRTDDQYVESTIC
jgi:hypothetical protein